MAIKDYFYSLSKEDRRAVLHEVCVKCDIGVSTFYAKLNKGFKELEEKAIKEIIDSYEKH